LDHGVRTSFARDATNGVWVNANKTSVPFGGYDVGRRIMFENRDYERAKRIAGIEHISAEHYIGGQRWGASLITKRGRKANTFDIKAVYPATIYLNQQNMIEGRFISDADVAQRRKSAVIGQVVADFLFEEDAPIGDWIVVGSVPFQVVGIFKDPRGPEEERRIYMPVSTAQLAFNGGEKLGQLQLTLGQATPDEAESIIEVIRGQLAEAHDFDPNDRQAVRVHNNIEQFDRF